MRGKGRDQHTPVEVINMMMTEFPSPCGEKVGINHKPARPSVRRREVVSVPLRGKGRDQHTPVEVINMMMTEFPSPCGEKVGINGVDGLHDPFSGKIDRFRPLAGKR